MTAEVSIFLQGMLFLILLHIIGHPIVVLVLRMSKIPVKLANLDFFQRLPLDFVTGGAVIYVVAIVLTPFQGFTALASWVVTGISAVFYLLLHLKKIASFRQPSKYSWIAFAGFVLALAIRVGPVSSFVLGSNQDISWHTLLTYSIIRSGGIPFSVIESYVLQVPLGVHTNLAYFSLISGIPAETVTFYSTVFFSALIGLAAYLFGSTISSKRFGLYVSLIMIAFSYYPSAITWGSDWLLLGLAVFFVAASLVLPFITKSMSFDRSTVLTISLPALITGFLASTYIPLYVILLMVSIFFVLLGRKGIVYRLKKIGLIFILGVPMFGLWLYRFFFLTQPADPYIAEQAAAMIYNQAYDRAAYFLPIKNLYSPYVLLTTLRNWLAWDDQNGWSGTYLFVPLLVIGCIILALSVLKRKSKAFRPVVPRYLAAVFLMTILWGLNSPVGLFYETGFGLGIMISELDKIAPVIGTILLPFIAVCGVCAIQEFIGKRIKARAWISEGLINAIQKTIGKRIKARAWISEGLINAIQKTIGKRIKARAWISEGLILILFLGSFAIAPSTKTWLHGSYNVFATSTESDYQLLNWMKTGIPSNSTVLVHPFDAGQYVPSIADKKTVGIASTGIVFVNQQYEDLNYHIRHNIMNSVTISLFRELRIDYVFVGGYPFKERWDDKYFIPNNQLYFTLIRSYESVVGEYTLSSNLFAVEIPNKSLGQGLINNSHYTGFSDGKTLIDLQHMAIYSLETGEGIYIEIGLRNQQDDILESMNAWIQPKSITVMTEPYQTRNARFTLTGFKYSFEFSMTSQGDSGINVHFSAKNAPPQSSIYISYFPINEVRQSNINFTTDITNRWSSTSLSPIQGVRADGNTFFQIIPKNDVILSTYTDKESGGYLTAVSHVAFDGTISTMPTDDGGNR